EVLSHGLGQGLDGLGRADVELVASRAREALELGFLEISRHDYGALGDEGLGDRAADPLSGRGDECEFAFEAIGHGGGPVPDNKYSDHSVQWLLRGIPLTCATRRYFTADLSTMPSASWSTMARWISCQGGWLAG